MTVRARSSHSTKLEPASLKPVSSWPDTIPDTAHTLGWPILEWSAEYLLQNDGPDAGEPFIYTEEQMKILLRIYEIDDEGKFKWRRIIIRRQKGHGKDPLIASLSLVELCGPCRFGGWDADGLPVAVPHPAPWIQICAVSQDQTTNTTRVFPGMISDKLKKDYDLDVGKTIIYTRHGKGQIEAVTSSPRAIEGKRTSFTVCNETHQWVESNEGHAMIAVALRNAAKSRDGSSRVVEITNAHLPLEGSVAEASYDAYMAGTLIESGVYYDSLEAPNIDIDIKAPENEAIVKKMIECARGDSWWVDPERIYQEILDPQVTISQAYRFYFNIPKRLEEDFLTEGSWASLAKPDIGLAEHARVVMALDGSGITGQGDTTAVVGCSISPTPYLFVIGSWPENEGDRVDVLEVEERIRDYAKKFQVVEIVADPYRWQRSLQVLEREGFEVLEYPQTDSRLMPATATFRKAVQDGSLSHDGNRKMAQHLVHATVKESNRGVRLFKPNNSSPLKIDLAIAAVMALERAQYHLGTNTGAASVFTGSDFLAKYSPQQLAEAQKAADKRIQDMIAKAKMTHAERMQNGKT